jgi:signal peptidase I
MISAAFIIASLVMRLMTFSPYLVEGPSMEPTLHSGELFILDQEAYKKADPQRGDIVVFSDPDKPDYFYVKRILGLPEERLHVTDKGLYIENHGKTEELPEPYLANAGGISKSYALDGYRDEIFAVPDGKYFVMGDNRSHSLDSRSFIYPFIPKENIKGKYLFTLIH